MKAITTALDAVQKATPSSFEELCDSMKSTWSDYTFKVNKTDKNGDDKATLSVTLRESGITKDDTLDTVKLNGKWFMVYKEIPMEKSESDSKEKDSEDTTSEVKDSVSSSAINSGGIKQEVSGEGASGSINIGN